MDKLEIIIAEAHSADFEQHTLTFQPVKKSFTVRAGKFAIIHNSDLDNHIQNVAIAFGKNIEQLTTDSWKITDWEAHFTDFLTNYYK